MEDAGDERNNFSGEEYEEEFEEIEVEEEVEEEDEEEDIGRGGEQNGGVVAKVDSGAGAEEKRPVNFYDSAASEGKIFVGGVAWETTEEIFTKHFKKYGEITDSVIMKDKHTRMPRGFGFVTFSDPLILDEVLKDEHVIDGRTVEVKRTVPRENMMSGGNGPKTKKIFVGGIPPSLTEDEFREYFTAYGKVAEHQIMLDHSTGRSRGFGFITFESEDSVEEIMADERTHELAGKQVELKRAVPKKAGGDSSFGGRGSYRPPGGVNMYGSNEGGGYGYGGGHRSGVAYGGRATPGVYGRGYGYGGGYGYGMGFGPAYGGLYGYGAGYGGYGAFYDAGGAAYGGGRYGNRYNPYGR